MKKYESYSVDLKTNILSNPFDITVYFGTLSCGVIRFMVVRIMGGGGGAGDHMNLRRALDKEANLSDNPKGDLYLFTKHILYF